MSLAMLGNLRVANRPYSGIRVSTPMVPATPTGLSVSVASSTSLTISWNPSAGATGYNLQRSTTGTGGWTSIPTVTSPHTDTGLTTNTTYYYQVDAVNGSGASAWSSNASGTPSSQTLFAQAWSPTSARLSLSTLPTGGTPVYGAIQSSPDRSSWSDVVVIYEGSLVLGSSANTFVHANLTPSGTYYWRVQTRDASGTALANSTVAGPVTMPSGLVTVQAPTSLTVSNVTSTSATISWTQPAYSGSNGLEDGFYVERSSDGGSTWRVVAPFLYRGAAYFVDNGLEPSTSNYCWRVTAFNGRTQTGPVSATYTNSATSAASSPTTTTSAASGSTPAAPTWQSYTGITVTGPSIASAMPVSDTAISLEWQLNDTNELGTKVEYSTVGSSGPFTELFVVGKWVWQTHVTGLTAGTTYWFRVRTFNAAGDSAYTSVVSATTLASGHNFVTDTTGAAGAPKTFLTPQQLAVYRQMAADYATSPTLNTGAKSWGRILAAANGTIAWFNAGQPVAGTGLTATETWGDQGQYAAIVYVVTGLNSGSTQYANAAYTILMTAPVELNYSNYNTPSSGQFTLTYGGQTTGNLNWNAAASDIQTALGALSNIGSGNVACSGGPLPSNVYVTFANQAGQALAGQSPMAIGSNVGTLNASHGPLPVAINYGAWFQINPINSQTTPALGNLQREGMLIAATVIDWCYAAWTTTQRANALTGWRNNVGLYLAWNAQSTIIEIGDANETNVNSFMNGYFGAVWYDAMGLDVQAGTLALQSNTIPWGGMQPSLTSQQPAVLTGPFTSPQLTAFWGTYASQAGGLWPQQRIGGTGQEGSEYNLASNPLYDFWLESIRHARSLAGDPNEYYPLARSAARYAGLAWIAQYTPDLQQQWEWFDTQTGFQLGNNGFMDDPMAVMGLAANMARGNATIGPFLLGAWEEFYAKSTAPWFGVTTPYWRAYLAFDPYAATQPRSSLPAGFYGSAMGLVLYHDGYGTNNSLFGCLLSPETHSDHGTRAFGQIQLYRAGEWALTQTLGYGGPYMEGYGANSMLVGGLSSFGNFQSKPVYTQGYRGPVAQAFGTSPNFSFQMGTTYGTYYAGTSPTNTGVYFGIPALAFCHEWSRSVVYLPSSDGHSDTIITFDRVYAQHPANVAPGATYTTPSITGIVAAGDGNCKITMSGSLNVGGVATLGAGDMVTISGVVGTTEANGAHIVTAVTSQTVFEIDVSFVNGYVSGGTVTASGTLPYSAAADEQFAYDGFNDKQRITSNLLTNVPDLANVSLGSIPAYPGTPALVQWICQAANTPTISSNTATWTTVGATGYGGFNNLALYSLLPASATIAAYNEQTKWSPPYTPVDLPVSKTAVAGVPYTPERRWMIKVYPGSNPWPGDSSAHFYPFLNVIFATDASGGPTVSATAVQDTGSSTAAGVLVHRSSLNDTLVMFSQVASSGLFPSTTFGYPLAVGYTVTWTSTTATTDVVLTHLSSAKTWTYTLDGGSSTPLTALAAGGGQLVGQLSVSGASSHTLVLTAS